MKQNLNKKIYIVYLGSDPAIDFAAQELVKYFYKSADIKCTLSKDINKIKQKHADFVLGIYSDLNIPKPKSINENDDWIFIQVKNKSCILSGSNPRSVLFAVYRYLHELGFQWIRPGKTGEIIPQLHSVFKSGLKINEKPSYFYRTLCLEGSASVEHIIDLIDWETKHGMNGYFIQFNYGTPFLKRWYKHIDNPFWKGKEFTNEDIKNYIQKIIREVIKRGLSLERMGHGWTCKAIGIDAEGWEKTENIVSEDKLQMLSLINGKRDFFQGVPVNTNLCYSNPNVRNAITDTIIDYIEIHQENDVIHFWLADGGNNDCECENCMKERVSDFYVEMLNELDIKLTEKNLPTKIIFLIYSNLFWEPIHTKIKNPNRFILMFAPISRSYLTPLYSKKKIEESVAGYIKNKLQLPKDSAVNVEYLKLWQKMFSGPGVDFDYHLLWACYYDLNQITIARTLYEDIKNLDKIGLNGFISCQNQRISFPHNLLLNILAQTLWNKKKSFRKILHESFAMEYGKEGDSVADFFTKMSSLWLPFFEPVFIPVPDEKRIKQGLNNLPKIQQISNNFKSVIQKNIKKETGARQISWKYLEVYLKMLDLYLPALDSYLKRSKDCRNKFEKYFTYLWKQEKNLHHAFDITSYVNVLKWRINEAEGNF